MPTTLEKIHRSALKFLAPLSLQATYAMVTSEAVKLVKGELGSILLAEEGALKRVYATDKDLFKILPKENDFMLKVFATAKPLLVSSKDAAKINPDLSIFNGSRDILVVPLINQGKTIGIFTIFSSREKKFEKEDLVTLTYFSSLATLAIRKTQLYEEVKKSLEMRDLFISMASHELKTPLTTINGYAQLLQQRLKNSGSIEEEWTNELAWETLRLSKLVQELLEINQIKTGHLQYVLGKYSLREIINRALVDFQFVHKGHRVSFQDLLKDKDDRIIGDFDKILQGMINLLDNAAKFSPKKEEILLTLDFQSPYFLITVQDFGPGIPKRNLPKIFQGFYRGRYSYGMGLGLFITKNVIENHKGTIEVESQIGQGTKITVKLPKAR